MRMLLSGTTAAQCRLVLLLSLLLAIARSSTSMPVLSAANCVSFNLTAPAAAAAPVQPPSSNRSTLDQLHAKCDGCSYGTAPGMWDPEAPTGDKWQVLSSTCRLTNLVQRYRLQNCSAPGPDAPPPKVLMLLGDSTDRELIEAIGQAFNATEAVCDGKPGWDNNRVHGVQVNPRCGGPIVARIHLYGSALDGPWDRGVSQNYEAILTEKVPHMWRRLLGLPDPDMILINCNLWDLARTYRLSQRNQTDEFEQPVLSRAFVDSWLANSTRLVTFVRGLFPRAVLGWHSVVIGKHRTQDGLMMSPQLGKKSFVEQLNAAGRVLASELGLLMVDYEAMHTRFHDFSYLKDNHHQSSEVSMEAANVYFNLLEQLPSLPKEYSACKH